jgi:threonine dehydratase
VAIAALLEEAVDVNGRRVVVVVSGSNIEASLLDQLLAGAAATGL